jgi:hypothetical protein
MHTFDPKEPIEDDYNAIPEGTYLVSFVKAIVKPLKSGNGHGLLLETAVCNGNYRGCHLFDFLNLWHTTSKQAANIAKKRMQSICECLGINETIQDFSVLYGQKIWQNIGLTEYDGREQNIVVGYTNDTLMSESEEKNTDEDDSDLSF